MHVKSCIHSGSAVCFSFSGSISTEDNPGEGVSVPVAIDITDDNPGEGVSVPVAIDITNIKTTRGEYIMIYTPGVLCVLVVLALSCTCACTCCAY